MLKENIPCVIGTAGHIDHGKTSLVRALTGMDTDRLPEEKKRGISIDLGFAHIVVEAGDGKSIKAAFVDVPGHERFIKNMLAGATGINFVLFAIAADDGVMPQTTEHLDAVRFLGVKKGIFTITKTDLVSSERVDEVKEMVKALIKNTVLSGSPVIGVSTVTGAGMDELRGLIKNRVLSSATPSATDAFFRLPVDRVFARKGFGAVVTGAIASGSVKKGDELVLFPSGKKVRVRGIESLHTAVDSACRGERAALNLTGVSHSEIGRGEVAASTALVRYRQFALESKIQYVDAVFEFVEGEGASSKKNFQMRAHHLTDDALCRISLRGSAKKNKNGLVAGRLILNKPLLMLRGDRFIIRDVSKNRTIGGGTVVTPYFSRSEALPLKTTGIFDAEDVAELAATLVREAGFIEIAEATLKLNVKEGFLKGLSRQGEGGFTILGAFIVDPRVFSALEKKAIDAVSEHHGANPMDAGMSEEALLNVFMRAVGRPLSHELMRLFLEDLLKRGILKRTGPALSLPGFSASASSAQSEIEKAVLNLIPKGFTAVSSADIMKLPFKKSEIEKALGYLQRKGAGGVAPVVVRLTEGSFISGASVKEAGARLEEIVKATGGIKASEFRDALGCGRKLAIEILEFFDREGFTVRKGDERVLRGE
ncbi:MAG: selenocysteine-specific translation elongation factor [Deltaproteobacteria bacterium]|nr:selenocysteine-specific translation elongation factor [Deltaproteobacteria bacterium]